jgi:ribosomal protein S18 acetylase RimI-like enzyme
MAHRRGRRGAAPASVAGVSHTSESLVLRRATAADAAEISHLYLESFRAALPDICLAHTDDQVRDWIREQLIPEEEVWAAVVAEPPLVVGFMALDGGQVDHLYVRTGWQRQGIGSRLLALARDRQPGGLELYTFQANAPARAFYERHGFVVVDLNDGERNEEHEPDVRYRWQPT